MLSGQEASKVCQVEKESSLDEPVRSKFRLIQGGKAMIFSPIINGMSEQPHIQVSNNIGTIGAFESCIGHGYREGKGRKPRINLLSDDVRVMGGFGLETAVVGPEVDGRGDTGNATFIYLGSHKSAKLQGQSECDSET